jgi:cytochrome c oxidase subunit III
LEPTRPFGSNPGRANSPRPCALHVLGAVVWLAILLIGARQGRFRAEYHLPIESGAIYWYYVSAVWAVIFALVYLGLR